MEKENISFEREGLFIRSMNICMNPSGDYRGMHSHLAIEIVKVSKGLLCCYIGNEPVWVQENEIILINSNIAHRLSADNAQISYTNIDISHYEKNDFYNEFASLYNFVSSLKAKAYKVFSDDKQFFDIHNKIYDKYYEEGQNSELYLKAYIYELIAFMHEHNFIMPSALFAEKIDKIWPVVKYIDANYRLPLTLCDICEEVKFNKYTVCHNFKAITGATIFEYINFLRINCATKKLKNKKLTILEIATDCGFSSVTYFNRVFKNAMGCSPSEYRKHIMINA